MARVLSLADLVARAMPMTAGPRRILGLAGAPGSGKSTLATALVRALGPAAALVPLDGFHLPDAELVRLGRRERKGAPDTFDSDGYVELLERLRAAGPDPVHAPAFDRDLEASVPEAIRVLPSTPLVVTEGNYLLLEDGPWTRVRPLLDEAWFLEIDDALRVERLVRRHVRHGKQLAQAREWVLRSDEANARLIATTRKRADLVVTPAQAQPGED